jgi:hypothetical protein
MYDLEIEPRQYPIHIRRGQVGHAMLEEYYTALMNGLSWLSAVANAKNVFLKYLSAVAVDDHEYIQMLVDLKNLMMTYFEYYKSDRFRILAVEKTYMAPMYDDIYFGLILDLLIEKTTGSHRGEIEIWDHKFVNNFKSDDDLRLDGQQPKYIMTAQLNGLPVKRAIFNQIRYRKMKDPKPEDLFRRSPLISTQEAINTVWSEATDAAIEINDDKAPIRRTLSYSACKFCFFKRVCMAELAGEPVDTMLKTEYKKRHSPLKDWMLTNG